MIIFFYGTTGESIKIATLVEAFPADRRILIDTSQQPKLLEKFYKATSFPRPDITLSKGWRSNDLTKPWQMFLWLFVVTFNFFFRGTYIKLRNIKKNQKLVMVVHGDTVTTVVGAFLGRILRVPVVHVEAGLRSGSWKHPFPEEIDRRIVSKLARIHYAPGEVPYQALVGEKTKGRILNTMANTVADSAKWAQKQTPSNLPKLPKKFLLVSVHRNEFLVLSKQIKDFLTEINKFSKKMPVVFLDHPITANRIADLKLDNILDSPGIKRVQKQNYINMMHLIKDAEVVVTDSGGLQEESYYLGIPCVVYREATERTEGIGENVVLTGFSATNLRNELSTYSSKLKIKTKKDVSPTKIIVDDLKNLQLF